MHRLHDPFVTAQDHRWEDCYTSQYSEDNTLNHNNSDILTKCE